VILLQLNLSKLKLKILKSEFQHEKDSIQIDKLAINWQNFARIRLQLKFAFIMRHILCKRKTHVLFSNAIRFIGKIMQRRFILLILKYHIWITFVNHGVKDNLRFVLYNKFWYGLEVYRNSGPTGICIPVPVPAGPCTIPAGIYKIQVM